MANPVGEDNWLAYVEEESRHASNLEARVKVVELFKTAVSSEPGSLKIWLAYCEWFWSLFIDGQSAEAGWPEDEQLLGREIFTFDAALSLWSEGYEAIKYRINDSNEFWDRWVSIELDQLARTRTPSGVKRISHLYRDRLQIPHSTWENTSQLFSSFLTTYNNAAYESEFKEVITHAQEGKAAYELREPHELALKKAIRSAGQESYKSKMKEYLDWEMRQVKVATNQPLAVSLCLGLYSRALSGIFTFDDDVWSSLAVYLSGVHHQAKTSQIRYVLPNMLDLFQRATSHCPWSGPLWSRYILTAEESGWSFQNVESIKHAATNTKALDRDGMTGVLDMYTAWCGFLKRTAMDPAAPEDAADVAQVGLLAALEDVELWGKRLYKDQYRGDPNYRLERILIQYLTEVKGDIEEARTHWSRMSNRPLLANSYDFWLNYYLWEMMVFSSKPKGRSPTPATPAGEVKAMRIPDLATRVLQRATARRTLDWPERVMEVYLQHCNDYEQPDTLHNALDTVFKARKAIAKRRERETAEATAAYAARQAEHARYQAEVAASEAYVTPDSPSGSKRKRESTPGDTTHSINKRAKSTEVNGGAETGQEERLKRDRENTSVMVTGLPPDVTQTAIRKYFKEYGRMKNIMVRKDTDGSLTSALIEFQSPEEVQSALLRDQKYFSQHQITVKPGTGLTLFVTNYPPAADEAYIRNIFGDCGEVFNVRWPSLKFNTHRRFCYVSFSDVEAAQKATRLDGKLLEGKFKLEAKYSDPTNKKKREGAVAEGRELRVKNLGSVATENDLRSIFGKYGRVVSARILANMAGQNLGTAYIVFEAKEQAENALELDKTKFRSQLLEVEVSKETNFKPFSTSRGEHSSKATSPAPSVDGDVAMRDEISQSSNADYKPTPQEIQARTMALMNVPDTVNDSRIRAIVEKYGEISKVVLRPDHQGAIIEFADPATLGRALLGLEGHEIVPGRKLRAGSVKELFKETSEKRDDKAVSAYKLKADGDKAQKAFMPPPQNVRRPVLGRGGAKRGLGFTTMKRTDDKDKAENSESPNGADDAGKPTKPKTNADFQAMFLASSGGRVNEQG